MKKRFPARNAFKKLFLWAFLLAAALPATAQEEAGEQRRYALVIGNSAYRHVDGLPNTARDASDIAEKIGALGFSVDLRLDSDLAGMTRSIGAWMQRLSTDRASEGFFWYAGHGVQVAGENYLLPVDIEADDEAAVMYGSYPLGRLLLSLEQTARNKLNVVVLDACRDNPFKNLSGGSRGLSRGFVTVENPPQDIFIMFSTSPGTVAADGEGGRNSPFAEAFIKHIDSGEILPVMAGLISRETMRLTEGKQRPYQNGSIVSDLYYSFAPAGAAPGRSSVAVAETAANQAALPALRNMEPPQNGPPPAPAMVSVPAGGFTMGSPLLEEDRTAFQEAGREARVDGFYIAAKQVTVGEFRRFVDATGYRTTAERAGGAFVYNETDGEWDVREGADWRRPGFQQSDDHPVVNTSWFDALSYCNWLSEQEGLAPAYAVNGEDPRWDRDANGYRLPTEAEWEYACRGGTATPFSTGSRISTAQANYNGNFPYANGNRGLFRRRTMPAGSFDANPWGLYDMHGNVWEWCWDYYGLYYQAGEEAIPPAINSAGPETGAHRVNRGGGWSSAARDLRSAARSSDLPETAGASLGFRLARNGD
jgi:formylglycine-generating enzyme required for sulfatase activity